MHHVRLPYSGPASEFGGHFLLFTDRQDTFMLLLLTDRDSRASLHRTHHDCEVQKTRISIIS